jgi:hypothetical protein
MSEERELQSKGLPESKEAKLLATIESGVGQLIGEMQQGHSERFLAYLSFVSRFHKYSFNNQLLIYLQRPSATRVAGYRAWQRMGYQVAEGQKGIKIFAPHIIERADPESGERERHVYFVVVSVFDASQLANLAGKPFPEFFTPLTDDCHEICGRLEQSVRADGIGISESQLGDTQGYSSHGHITLKAGLDSQSRFLVLTHEYAHELLHWDEAGKEQPRPVKECQAEAVSYVVASHFGVHNPFAADYLQNWGNTPADLAHELQSVGKAAGNIISKLEESTPFSEGIKPYDSFAAI